MSKLAVLVIGNRNAGKSRTWYELFGGRVRTGSQSRQLTLRQRTLSVFLVSGSPEERKTVSFRQACMNPPDLT